MKERIEVCKEHLEFSLKWKGPILGVVETRRHYTNYFKHIPSFKNKGPEEKSKVIRLVV